MILDNSGITSHMFRFVFSLKHFNGETICNQKQVQNGNKVGSVIAILKPLNNTWMIITICSMFSLTTILQKYSRQAHKYCHFLCC